MTSAEQVIERIEVAGGVLSVRGDRIHCQLPEDAAHLLDELKAHKGEVIACLKRRAVPPMPDGVELLTWNPKRPPVAITQCAVVTDVERFVAATLQQLGRLLLRRQPDYHRLRDLVDALEQCGVVVKVAGIGSASGGRQ